MVNLEKFSNLLATCFGIGMISWLPAPGTVVSFLSIVLWYILNIFFSWRVLFFLYIFIVGLGCYVCHETNKNLGVHDHRCIVLDEFIGMWCVLILSSDLFVSENWLKFFFVFFCFRMFDIYKPWPIFLIDKNIRNGIGIVFDDIMAGMMTFFVLFLVSYCSEV